MVMANTVQFLANDSHERVHSGLMLAFPFSFCIGHTEVACRHDVGFKNEHGRLGVAKLLYLDVY